MLFLAKYERLMRHDLKQFPKLNTSRVTNTYVYWLYMWTDVSTSKLMQVYHIQMDTCTLHARILYNKNELSLLIKTGLTEHIWLVHFCCKW
jgi:vacuolar-type H+-ATPase catalytic subunit A/Vma1